MTNTAGKPLRYRIGADGPVSGAAGEIVVAPYGERVSGDCVKVAYCNLFDQHDSYDAENNTGEYGPYLDPTDTSAEYEEGVIDPRGAGWNKNLTEQFEDARRWASAVELDNPDAYAVADVSRAVYLAATYNLAVWAKNPLAMRGDPAPYVAESCGIIIESDDDVTVAKMDALRRRAGKSDMALRFIGFNDEEGGREFAERIAQEARAGNYINVGVTYDASDQEYGGEITDILVPRTAATEVRPDTMAVPKHLEIARSLIGTDEYVGGDDNPKVLGFAKEIGRRFPDMAAYCAQYTHDEIPWCGLFAGYCVAMAGIRPVFGPTDTDKFLWAQAWKQFGTHVSKPQLGDVLVLARHVTFYNGEDGDYYLCLGGNQSDRVNVVRYSKDTIQAIRRPPSVVIIDQTPAPVTRASNFDKCLPLLLAHEGGNDDDPDDPGGRTSRGILQREWDVWRQSHPGLPADVWKAPQDQVEAIYRLQYWDAMLCDELLAGVDYAVFDYGVNSGISRSASVLQRFVGAEVDGEIGPETIGKTVRADPRSLIAQISDQRMAFLRGLGTWWKYGKGWTTRVNDVRAAALTMAAVPKPPVHLPPAPQLPPLLPPREPDEILLPGDLDPAIDAAWQDIAAQMAPIFKKSMRAHMPKAILPPAAPPPLGASPDTAAIIAAVIAAMNAGKPIALPPPAKPVEAPPPAESEPVIQKPSVQLSAYGLAAAIGSMLMGWLGTPFGMGTEPTDAGTAAVVAPILTALIGVTGGWGGVLKMVLPVVGAIGKAMAESAAKPKA